MRITLEDAVIKTMQVYLLNWWRAKVALALTERDADVSGLVDILC